MPATATPMVMELFDRLWAVLADEPNFVGYVRAGNRLRRDVTGSHRKGAHAPADLAELGELEGDVGPFREYDDPAVRTLCGVKRLRDQTYVFKLTGPDASPTAPNTLASFLADLWRAAAATRPPFGLSYVDRLLDVAAQPAGGALAVAPPTAKPQPAQPYVLRLSVAVRLVVSDGIS